MDGGDGGRQAVAPSEHEPGKFQKPCRAGERLGHVEERRRDFVEEAAVVIRLAERADGGKDGRPSAEEIDEFRADDTGRTARRHVDRHIGQRQWIGGIVGEAWNEPTIDEARRDRFQEGQARGDREDAPAPAARHAAASRYVPMTASAAPMASGVPTVIQCPSSMRPKSRPFSMARSK